MGLILDSSEIIALERNRWAVDSLVAGREDEPFGISVATVAELLHGVERADTETRKIRQRLSIHKLVNEWDVSDRYAFEILLSLSYFVKMLQLDLSCRKTKKSYIKNL